MNTTNAEIFLAPFQGAAFFGTGSTWGIAPGWSSLALSVRAPSKRQNAGLPARGDRNDESTFHLSTFRLFDFSTFVLALGLLVAGCSPPGLLITPVTTRRELVEAQLGREGAFARDKIAVIEVSGLLINWNKPQLLGEGEHPVSLLLEQLDRAAGDPSVKAVLLRLNSPGGTVTASQLMYDEVRYFRAQTGKPVVAVLMDVAASGGYFIACACDEIIAQSSTVTGSIGVVMQTFELSGTMEMIGVKGDAITSGTYKDTGSPFRPMRPDERQIFQSIVDDMYERFVQVVVQGRPALSKEKVRALADGRVYIADQALKAGLVDRVATMREAIDATKKRAGLRSIRLVTYQRPLAYRPNYYAAAPGPTGGDVNLLKIESLPWLTPAPRFLYLWSPGTTR